jgi:hypothetical protein
MPFARKSLAVICLVLLLAGMTPAETEEVSTRNETREATIRKTAPRSWLTEFDITFWQTVPLAVFWSYAVASQTAHGGEINWSPVLNCSALISVANAGWHASRLPAERAGSGR